MRSGWVAGQRAVIGNCDRSAIFLSSAAAEDSRAESSATTPPLPRRRNGHYTRQVLSRDPDAMLVRLRALCLAMRETGEKVSHGIPAFHVAGRMFAYFRHDHHG